MVSSLGMMVHLCRGKLACVHVKRNVITICKLVHIYFKRVGECVVRILEYRRSLEMVLRSRAI